MLFFNNNKLLIYETMYKNCTKFTLYKTSHAIDIWLLSFFRSSNNVKKKHIFLEEHNIMYIINILKVLGSKH